MPCFPGRYPLMRSYPLLLAVLLSAGVVSSCGQTRGNDAVFPGRLGIVTTTGMLADLAAQIGGEHVSVTGLMGPGVDPHLYKASAGDVTRLSGADVILYNGVHLEGKMADVFARMRPARHPCIRRGRRGYRTGRPDRVGTVSGQLRPPYLVRCVPVAGCGAARTGNSCGSRSASRRRLPGTSR